MSSVTCHRRVWQLSWLGLTVVLSAVLVGCEPAPPAKQPEKKPTPTEDVKDSVKPATDTKVEKDTKVGKKVEATPDVKAATKPVEKAADAKPVDKPADKPADKAADKPVEKAADKPADKSADDSADPKTVTAKKVMMVATPTPAWMPKPVTSIPETDVKDAASMKLYTEKIPGTEIKFEMAPIPGGKFAMGSPKDEKGHKDDEGPVHDVTVEPFWMETHEVTWDEYELWGLGLDKQRRELNKIASTDRDKIVDTVAIPTKPYADMTFGMGKEGFPAICMTQFAAKVYCKWLSGKTGRYYRLPTEAEWELACRAGKSTAYSFGDKADKLGDYAWFTDNSDDKYHKIATKKPNALGLYDMHGNVSEWVLDQFVPDFYKKTEGKTADNPLAPPTAEYGRVVRGGSWDDDALKCRSAVRRASEKDWKKQDPQIPQSIWYLTDGNFVGFRVIHPLRTPTAEEAKKYEVDEDQLTAYKDYIEAQANKQ